MHNADRPLIDRPQSNSLPDSLVGCCYAVLKLNIHHFDVTTYSMKMFPNTKKNLSFFNLLNFFGEPFFPWIFRWRSFPYNVNFTWVDYFLTIYKSVYCWLTTTETVMSSFYCLINPFLFFWSIFSGENWIGSRYFFISLLSHSAYNFNLFDNFLKRGDGIPALSSV